MKKKKILFLSTMLFGWAVLSGQTIEDSLIILNAKWEIAPIEKGMIHKHLNPANLYKGAQNINIVEIDFKKKPAFRAEIILSDSCDITSNMARGNNALVALNASYYDDTHGTFKSTCFYRVDNSTLFPTDSSEWYRVNGALRIVKGKVELIDWNKNIEDQYKKKKGVVLSSGPLMVKKGKICDFTSLGQKFINDKHPRSAIGITKDDKLLLVTVDGRFPDNAIGVNIPELAQLMKLLGCNEALNLDGGRSTTLWSHNADSGNGVLNCPAGNKKFDHAGERCISNILIIK